MMWTGRNVRIEAVGAVIVLLWGTSVLATGGLQRSQAGAPGAAASAPAVTSESSRALVDQYCVTCHSERLKTGKLVLEHIGLDDVPAGAEVWEKVIKKLRTGSMPPAGASRPASATLDGFASWLETTIDAAAEATPNPGTVVIHRLNRTEYVNAIRDLLGVDVDGRSLLPADNSGYGFDNIGDVLTVSPGLVDRYLIAGRRVVRLAMADPATRAVVETYKVSTLTWQHERLSEDLPFGSRGGIAVRHTFPADGEYVLRLELLKNAMTSNIKGTDVVNQIDVRIDGERATTFTVGGTGAPKPGEHAQDSEELEFRVPIKAGARLIAVSFDKANWAYEGAGPEYVPIGSTSYSQVNATTASTGKAPMGLGFLHISGPFEAKASRTPPASRQRIFVCQPTSARDEPVCAKTILTTIARRAYRRPLGAGDVQSLMQYYDQGVANGGFEGGIRLALQRIFVSPDFLFRVERDPASAVPGSVYRISDLDLASRLSFFLWSSVPDDQLLDLAADQQLTQPEVLERQVTRMLADPRASALLSNFFGQWLRLRSVRSIVPDVNAFPDFDDNLLEAFERETQLFLESQLQADRPVVELLNADYTFVNERLARHYEIPNVYGSRFRRVAYQDDRRAGLFGQGSILTVTSYANRTSPVLRGKFLLENVLGTPPPAPPPNVPPFPESEGKALPTSVRERMEQHRKNPVCATCHNQIDPLGFALDNFDALGAWRTKDGTSAVDPTGNFPNGMKFDGPATFREALLTAYGEQFVGVVTERLLTYALGRGVEYHDMPAIRTIMRNSASSEYRWSSIILEIVKSMPFQVRRSQS